MTQLKDVLPHFSYELKKGKRILKGVRFITDLTPEQIENAPVLSK